jgi:hypothetical protein
MSQVGQKKIRGREICAWRFPTTSQGREITEIPNNLARQGIPNNLTRQAACGGKEPGL